MIICVGPKSNGKSGGVFLSEKARGNLEAHRGSPEKRRGHVTTGAEMGAMGLPARNVSSYQELEDAGTVLPLSLGGLQPCPHLDFGHRASGTVVLGVTQVW